ncbi:uncharacterized protein PHALS_05053 [Plasmopara halstedii]|uniref:Uncharacterized protein n=1 Tax=Plasmopara halstedii TaxID=4781 RepID=A0A0P1ABA1_PLAHL|nr:uncharacterized protein PHALS_05053 [Plasmopara halstedii]CEG37460.1 hypothetical protein PHALS_05053 [Plasmopara halstedii]|eukprot:XP_024573829.1 hypothetical protein PHALS_05053 [Plasmopara halstedii]
MNAMIVDDVRRFGVATKYQGDEDEKYTLQMVLYWLSKAPCTKSILKELNFPNALSSFVIHPKAFRQSCTTSLARTRACAASSRLTAPVSQTRTAFGSTRDGCALSSDFAFPKSAELP